MKGGGSLARVRRAGSRSPLVQLVVLVPKRLREQAIAKSKREYVSVSSVVRKALEEWVNEEKKGSVPR